MGINLTFSNYNTMLPSQRTGMYRFSGYNWNFSNVSSADESTYEGYKKKLEEEQAKKEKTRNDYNQQSILNHDKAKTIDEIQSKVMQCDEQIQSIEKEKNKDGASTIRMKHKDLDFMGKVGRWASNTVSAIKNIGSTILKADAKTLTFSAVAIAACFIPVVGPYITVALSGVALAGAAGGLYKGVQKLDSAENSGNDKQIDEAQQDIAANAILGVLAAFGFKAGIKTFKTPSSPTLSASASSGSASAGTSTVTASAGRLSKVKQFVLNPAKKDLAAIRNDGFLHTLGNNFKSLWSKSSKDKFEGKYNALKDNVDARLKNVNSEINTLQKKASATSALTSEEQCTLALLKEEKLLLQRNSNELNLYFSGTRNKASYAQLLKDNSYKRFIQRVKNRSNSSSPYTVNGKEIPQKQLAKFNKQMMIEQKNYANSLKELIKSKECLMRSMAKNPDKNRAVLDKYVSLSDVSRKWYKPSHWFRNDYKIAIGGSNASYKGMFGLLAKPQAAPIYSAYLLGDKEYSAPFLFAQELSSADTTAQLAELKATKTALEQEITKIRDMKTADEYNAYMLKLAEQNTPNAQNTENTVPETSANQESKSNT